MTFSCCTICHRLAIALQSLLELLNDSGNAGRRFGLLDDEDLPSVQSRAFLFQSDGFEDCRRIRRRVQAIDGEAGGRVSCRQSGVLDDE